ncbi:MAG: Hsp20 family protein [Candidatus Devosia euplotis]|nr:Hsp20 family protein [Candidatus Devosia euplotis]
MKDGLHDACFGVFRPFLLGFDSLGVRVDRLAKSADGYPPYNIACTIDEQGTEQFVVSIAVAGFGAHEHDVMAEDNQIIVRGKQKDEPGREFLHRGIATRQFQRAFLLADGMMVKDATLGHGMLVIAIDRPQPPKAARRIEIR